MGLGRSGLRLWHGPSQCDRADLCNTVRLFIKKEGQRRLCHRRQDGPSASTSLQRPRKRRDYTMAQVLCSIGSTMPNGAFAIRAPVWIEVVEWEAFVTWSKRVLRPTEYPALTSLLATDLPKTLEPDALVPLREESAHVAQDSLEGSAADGLSHWQQFLDQALAYVEACRASGSPETLTINIFVPGVGRVGEVQSPSQRSYGSKGEGRASYGSRGRRY